MAKSNEIGNSDVQYVNPRIQCLSKNHSITSHPISFPIYIGTAMSLTKFCYFFFFILFSFVVCERLEFVFQSTKNSTTDEKKTRKWNNISLKLVNSRNYKYSNFYSKGNTSQKQNENSRRAFNFLSFNYYSIELICVASIYENRYWKLR